MTSQDTTTKRKASTIFDEPNDFKSSVRLNYNHWLMKSLCGYLLHPKIQCKQDEMRVADIGAGTALWLLELSEELPSTATLDGFDISTAQYPPKDFVPKNLHLQRRDVFENFPEELKRKYDVVHIQFALCFVNNVDAEPLLKNVISLLKPSGYIQWFEPDVYNCKVKAPASNLDTSTAAVEQLNKMFHKPTPTSTYDWVQGLPGLCEKHGLKVIEQHNIPMKDSLRLLWSHSSLQGLEELRGNSSIKGTEKAEGLENLINGLKVEFAQGVSLDTPWVCVVGQKLS